MKYQLVDLTYNVKEPRDPHTGRWIKAIMLKDLTAEGKAKSRPVSYDEFQNLAATGKASYIGRYGATSPQKKLSAETIDRAYKEAQAEWGGSTIDSHTGAFLPDGADKYAMTVKPLGVSTIEIPDTASHEEFASAMRKAHAQFDSVLQRKGHYLGVFHDSTKHTIEFDPSVLLDNLNEVESIGAYTHAVGGAYHFKSGNGFWPPHVKETK